MFGLDIIGDIHGYADRLHRLLTMMDYREIDGAYYHPERKVMFLGDFIDRGPEQKEVLRLVRSMCGKSLANAIMGNHEFNAIGWVTESGHDLYLRSHNHAHRQQHQEFLDQFVEGSAAHMDAIDWFRTLPVFRVEMGQRFVHACWHKPSLNLLSTKCLDMQQRFTKAGFLAAHDRQSPLNGAMETVLKGPELKLPDTVTFKDKSGHVRQEARIKWWDLQATRSMRTGLLGLEESSVLLPDQPVGEGYAYKDEVPVFFGHYWLKGQPDVTSNYAQCLDYSVAKGGYLTAYRWSGEQQIVKEHLIWC
ncbi:MAG: metallophosphoesterase [Methylocystaceae bacterium]|nr:metallophosphoesterase [Methylocystaceae bacterium]